MKKNYRITLVMMLLAAAGFLLQSCGKDNKEPYPPSKVYGSITYQGQPVRLISTNSQLTATGNAAFNTLWLRQTAPQPLSGNDIRVAAKNDGTFTATVFDGDYRLYANSGRVPFEDFTPKDFTLKGEQKIDVEVVPFFWISNYNTSFVDSVFTATFKLDKISTNTAMSLAEVRVYFNTTNYADASANILSRGFTTATGIVIGGNCTIKVDLKRTAFSVTDNISFQNAKKARGPGKLWANVGVRINGITDALYQLPVALN